MKKDEAYLTAFGKRLKGIRTELGFSQLQLALRAGVSKAYLSDLERGKRNPSLSTLHRIEEALGLPLSLLLSDLSRPKESEEK